MCTKCTKVVSYFHVAFMDLLKGGIFILRENSPTRDPLYLINNAQVVEFQFPAAFRNPRVKFCMLYLCT